MADIYEFHVAGLIGPVARSALPELITGPGDTNSVLSGQGGPDDVDDMLQRLGDAGLTTTHIVITANDRWRSGGCAQAPAAGPQSTGEPCSGGAVPVVHDHSAQDDVLD